VSEQVHKLKDAVQVMHRCTATHRESVPVQETFQGKVVWAGVVEVFDISGNPKASRCYAWRYHDDRNESKFVTLLKQPPAMSPQSAVHTYVASLGRK